MGMGGHLGKNKLGEGADVTPYVFNIAYEIENRARVIPHIVVPQPLNITRHDEQRLPEERLIFRA
jgi:hypothetical protein